MKPDAESILDVDGLDDRDLYEDLKGLLTIAEETRPRSQQRALGPSEVGHRCMRKLAFGLVNARSTSDETRGPNKGSDPLPAISGTAMHTVVEEGARKANEKLGRTRWIPEAKVTVREGLSGTCDLYDIDTGTVLDWKFPGSSRFTHYSKHGPSDIYRGQAHLYGRGYKNLGVFPVHHVGIMFVSRSGSMRQTKLWREPYSDEVVDEILARLDTVEGLITATGAEVNPMGFLQIPVTPSDDCTFCPWFQFPGSGNPDNPRQCWGMDESRVRP